MLQLESRQSVPISILVLAPFPTHLIRSSGHRQTPWPFFDSKEKTRLYVSFGRHQQKHHDECRILSLDNSFCGVYWDILRFRTFWCFLEKSQKSRPNLLFCRFRRKQVPTFYLLFASEHSIRYIRNIHVSTFIVGWCDTLAPPICLGICFLIATNQASSVT